MAASQSQLLLGLYLVATLAVFAAASDSFRGWSCRGTIKALVEARDGCCNELGKRGQCIGICSATKEVFDSVTFLHLCGNYDACSASWNDVKTGDGTATSRKEAAGGCSSDKDKTAKQCSKVVKVLDDHKGCFTTLLKESSGDDESFKSALVTVGLGEFHGVIMEKLLN